MADYDLGTARGKIDIDGEGAVTGFGKADAAQQKFSRGAKVSGAIIAGAGVGIAAGLGLAINSAANFEERMSAVEAVSGATGKELDKLRELALQLGADTKFSATEAASAIEELVKAGIPVEDVLNGAADAAVNLAAAGEIELAEAATIAANALNVFNLRGEDMEHVADLIAGAANASAIDVSEFGLSLQQAGATASLVGLSFDDLTLAIAAMGNAGIKGSDAGTSLKTFLANLQPTTEKQITLFKELGLLTEDMGNQFFDAQGKIKPIGEIAEILQTSLAHLTDQQKALALETLFGSDAIRAAAIIAGEGAEGFEELATSIGKVSAEEVAETRMDNLRGSIEQLKGSVETLAIRFGTPLLNAVRGVVDFITRLANAFSELSPGVQKTIGIILAIVAAFLVLGGTILLVVGWFGSVATAVGLSIGALAGVIGIAFAVIAAIGLLVAGIVLLYKENETFRNIIQGIWNWIKTTIPPIIDTIVTGVKALIAAFQDPDVTSDGFVGVMERIGVAARMVWDWITGTLIPAIKAFADFIVNDAAPAVANFAGTVMDVLGAAWQWIDANVMPVITAFGELIVAVFNRVKQNVEFTVNAIMAVIGFLAPWFEMQFNVIKTIITTFINIVLAFWRTFGDNILNILFIAFNAIKGIVQGALQALQGIIQLVTGIITLDWSKAWEGIKNIFGGVWDIMFNIASFAVENIVNVIMAAWEFLRGLFQAVWDANIAILQAAWDFIVGIITGALDFIIGLWQAQWNFVISFIQGAWDTVSGIVSGGVSAVVSFISGLPGSVASVLSGLASTLYSIATGALSSMLQGVTEGITSVLSTLGGLPLKILQTLANLGSLLYNAGKNLIQGFIDGISSMIDDVKGVLGGITSGLTSWKGPPRKDRVILEPVGELVMEGFIRGIANQIDPLRSLLAGIGPEVSDRLASGAMTTARPSGSSTITNTTDVTFNFPNVTSAEDAAAIESALSTSDVMRTLLDTLRAGRRTN